MKYKLTKNDTTILIRGHSVIRNIDNQHVVLRFVKLCIVRSCFQILRILISFLLNWKTYKQIQNTAYILSSHIVNSKQNPHLIDLSNGVKYYNYNIYDNFETSLTCIVGEMSSTQSILDTEFIFWIDFEWSWRLD